MRTLSAYTLVLILFFESGVFAIAPSETFDEFLTVYHKYGGGKYMIQEEITQEFHVLQAAYLASLAGAPEDVIIGLLFHDVGQVAYEENIGHMHKLHADHAELGGLWLREHNFPEFVCEWVENHALAKVILCEEELGYYERLSEASKISYWIQRDKYEEEPYQTRKIAFLNHPRKEDFKTARKCDDMAKIVGFNTIGGILPSLESYRAMTIRVIENRPRDGIYSNWKNNVNQLYEMMAEDREVFEDAIRSSQVKFLD